MVKSTKTLKSHAADNNKGPIIIPPAPKEPEAFEENDAISTQDSSRNPNSRGSLVQQPLGGSVSKSLKKSETLPLALNRGRPMKDLWKVCCNEVAAEKEECNKILAASDLPPMNFSKDKKYPLIDYEEAPELETSKANDFLDFYVFPILLPGIQALLQFGQENRVFQCKFPRFNGIDFVVQYLYNNNPRYPERLENPVNLEDIPFVKAWLKRYPRPRQPKWLIMTKEEAVRIIQRNVRGFFIRRREDVHEMRQFWMTTRTEEFEERFQSVLSNAAGRFKKSGEKMTLTKATLIIQSAMRGFFVRRQAPVHIMRQRWKEDQAEEEEEIRADSLDHIEDNEPHEDKDHRHLLPAEKTHSEDCVMCLKFRELLEAQQRALEEARQKEELELERKESKKMSRARANSRQKSEFLAEIVLPEIKLPPEVEAIIVEAPSVEVLTSDSGGKRKSKPVKKHKKSMKGTG